jgi:hypothetical protein
MNNKHIACIVIALLCVLIFQGVSMVRTRALAMQKASETAKHGAELSGITLTTQRAVLNDLKVKSADLIEYLGEWEPHFARLSTPESGEINVNALIKQDNLVLLAQRFEVSPNKTEGVGAVGVATIPRIVRAHLTIEDDFIKTMNWLGAVESKLPISRVSNLDITRGQTGNDVRMNVVIDIPQAVPRPSPEAKP